MICLEYQNENFNGIYDFRCGFHNGWQVGKHIHEYSELLYCQQGECEVYINGKKIALSEKQLVWLPPNYIHQYECTDASVICAVFSKDFIPAFFEILKGKRLIASAINIGDIANIIESLHLIDKHNILLISAYLNLICSKVIDASSFVSATLCDGVLYQNVVSYLSEHFREDISLKKLSAKIGYNPKYLSHALHTLTGIHFSKLLALYRIEYAKKLLISENFSDISTIALESGFSAINTFNRVFKEFTGMTPTEYKNNYLIN